MVWKISLDSKKGTPLLRDTYRNYMYIDLTIVSHGVAKYRSNVFSCICMCILLSQVDLRLHRLAVCIFWPVADREVGIKVQSLGTLHWDRFTTFAREVTAAVEWIWDESGIFLILLRTFDFYYVLSVNQGQTCQKCSGKYNWNVSISLC